MIVFSLNANCCLELPSRGTKSWKSTTDGQHVVYFKHSRCKTHGWVRAHFTRTVFTHLFHSGWYDWKSVNRFRWQCQAWKVAPATTATLRRPKTSWLFLSFIRHFYERKVTVLVFRSSHSIFFKRWVNKIWETVGVHRPDIDSTLFDFWIESISKLSSQGIVVCKKEKVFAQGFWGNTDPPPTYPPGVSFPSFSPHKLISTRAANELCLPSNQPPSK